MEQLCYQINKDFITQQKKGFFKPNTKYHKLLTTNKKKLTEMNNYIKLNIDTIDDNIVYSLHELYNNLDDIPNIGNILKLLNQRKNDIEKTILLNYDFKEEFKAVEIGTEKLLNYNSIKKTQSIEIKEMITIVENYIRDKKLLCYGGQAINNILPKDKQFYQDSDLPDYDFFSPNAKDDAIELSNIFHKNKFKYIEAKEAIHDNTYKIFVNFEPIADITQIPKYLFYRMRQDSEIVDGIHYVSANILRMGIYIEISRPKGDITRWNKLYHRLHLLNTYKPIKKCKFIIDTFPKLNTHIDYISTYLQKNDVVLFGPQCFNIYNSIGNLTSVNKEYSRFYLLSNNYKTHSNDLTNILNSIDNKSFIKRKHYPIFERVPSHYIISYKNIPLIIIFKTDDCYSYHKWNNIKIATIETILRFFFSFLLVKRSYLNTENIICMANELIQLQKINYDRNIDIFDKFTTNCIGNPITKSNIFKKRWDSKKRFFYRPENYTIKIKRINR